MINKKTPIGSLVLYVKPGRPGTGVFAMTTSQPRAHASVDRRVDLDILPNANGRHVYNIKDSEVNRMGDISIQMRQSARKRMENFVIQKKLSSLYDSVGALLGGKAEPALVASSTSLLVYLEQLFISRWNLPLPSLSVQEDRGVAVAKWVSKSGNPLVETDGAITTTIEVDRKEVTAYKTVQEGGPRIRYNGEYNGSAAHSDLIRWILE